MAAYQGLTRVLYALACWVLVSASPAPLAYATELAADGACTQPIDYVFGFADLHRFLGPIMGHARTCETPDPNGTGDVHQTTTVGLAFWRRATNTPTFTNGFDHWAHTVTGWRCWTGASIDPPPTAGLCTDMLIAAVRVAETPPDLPAYDRGRWRHWIDVNHNRCDTRAEVLIVESRTPVTFRDRAECKVGAGQWISLYSGAQVTDSGALEIDHLVPLANAHRSGAWQWDDDRRTSYANDLDDPEHLIAVEARLNQSKADRGPDEWLPPDRTAWCAYAQAWLRVKIKWQLTVTAAEKTALERMLALC